MLKRLFARGIWAAVLLSGCHAAQNLKEPMMRNTGVHVVERDATVAIGNALVEVTFDLKVGEYQLAGRRDPRCAIDGARFHLADTGGAVLVPRAGTRHAASSQDVTGPQGKGKRLAITAATAGGPDLLLEVELYEGKGFVVLNAGLENKTGKPIQVGRIHPIVAAAFKGENVAEGFAALDGTTGCLPTRVWTEGRVECRNGLLAKFGRKPTRCLVIGGLTYHDFEKFARIDRKKDRIEFDCWSEDPVGRRVEPGERYLPNDKIYVDLCSQDPFQALEQYARCVKAAQGIALPVYDFPTAYGPRTRPAPQAVATRPTSSPIDGLQGVTATILRPP